MPFQSSSSVFPSCLHGANNRKEGEVMRLARSPLTGALGEGFDARAGSERGAMLVEADVVVRTDAYNLHVDPSRVPDRLLIGGGIWRDNQFHGDMFGIGAYGGKGAFEFAPDVVAEAVDISQGEIKEIGCLGPDHG